MLAGAALLGCAPFQIYRPLLDTYTAPDELSLSAECSQHAVEVLRPALAAKPGHTLGFIEFDDQGQLWSAQQMSAVLVNVDKKLIADHDDIWRPGVRDFITHLILISSQSNDLNERANLREAAKK